MTIDEMMAVVDQAFPDGATEFAAALALLKAQIDLHIAGSRQRLAAAQASAANQAAQTVIQQAQAAEADARAQFDALVASMAG